MITIPAVDIKNGKCVQLVQGKPGTEQVVIDNPVEVALGWQEKGAEMLHLIDLDGAFGDNRRNQELIASMVEELSIPIEMGGGIRSKEDVTKLLNTGIERVILGTLAMENPDIVTELSKEFASERVMVALDSKDNQVVVKGWTEKTSKTVPQMGRIMEEAGTGSILFTNVDYEGLLEGFQVDPLLKLLEAVDIPVVYAGGVSSLDDLKVLSDTDVYGVVIGSALYRGKIDFEEALKL
ncbi:MAG: 1-(5-phosphoribosyl)-5-[(5-phosphoribosylamino)methylideneamino]imidazole-4-carboxamide isomerase [Methanobacteriaceae archaeon]|jgi:phosphoribosylformimino-5-aminoimidazole carboxamide ribotide isomerase|nr:1-(5-phosphoribosyl)-5-[(5-phosphoribosylamino)methylideneamino]imidazole-4-carboxamide isomerase [Methanobacteriaceae archaeon]